jgi:hypothetical protein
MKETAALQVVWTGPVNPESGVRVRVALVVAPGIAETDAGEITAVRGGVMVRVWGAEAEAA